MQQDWKAIKYNIFVLEMKELFALKDKFIKVEHIGCLSKVMNWKVGHCQYGEI
jgi:hypothetical protein